MALIDDIATRHRLDGAATRLPLQGVATEAFAVGDYVVKIAHEAYRDQVYTETLVAPLARAVGVRTPALVAWARRDDCAYSVWERVDGAPLDERSDAAAWRDVGRELAKLHAIDRCDDARGLLHKRPKRDARPHLHRLPDEGAAFFGRWIERCDRAAPAAPRLLHGDVHGLNVLCGAAGTTLIDWGDATWGDPAVEFGSMPIVHVPDALAGYEERASLGADGEGRIMRALIGHAVRMLVQKRWERPMAELLAFRARADLPARFGPWLV